MGNQPSEWRCSVCGYVHNGEAAPQECVVCGAPENKFEAWAGRAPTEKKDTSGWKCIICNHVHEETEPPEACPVCGATTEKFERISREGEKESFSGMVKRIVIVGAGIAGISAAETVRNLSGEAEITILSKEAHLPYYRLNLTRLLAGEITAEALPIHTENWYQKNNIILMTNAEVTECNPTAKNVTLRDGKTIEYDKLILTAGAHPFIPPVPGADKNGVTTLRTSDNADYIYDAAGKAKSVTVVGGGILGLETAGALAKSFPGLSVTVIEGFDYLMPRQLNKKASTLLMKHIEGIGIKLETGTTVKEIEGDEYVGQILLGNGKTLPSDLVIFAAGVRPNSYLARISGLNVNHGIIVNDYMESSVESIYASGDISEHRGTLYGLWNAAMYQGSIAGMNAVGQKAGFGGIPRSNTIKVLGIDLFSIGTIEPCDGSCTVLEKEEGELYLCLIFRDGRIEGAILYEDTTKSSFIKKSIEDKRDFSSVLSRGLSLDEILDLPE